MKITLIKVYDYDYDYTYNREFVVESDIEKEKELNTLREELINMDSTERYEKYETESVIDIVENFIEENFIVIKNNRLDIDCNY